MPYNSRTSEDISAQLLPLFFCCLIKAIKSGTVVDLFLANQSASASLKISEIPLPSSLAIFFRFKYTSSSSLKVTTILAIALKWYYFVIPFFKSLLKDLSEVMSEGQHELMSTIFSIRSRLLFMILLSPSRLFRSLKLSSIFILALQTRYSERCWLEDIWLGPGATDRCSSFVTFGSTWAWIGKRLSCWRAARWSSPWRRRPSPWYCIVYLTQGARELPIVGLTRSTDPNLMLFDTTSIYFEG